MHLLSCSAAVGWLLAARLLVGFALIQITRHGSSRVATLLGIAIITIPIIVTAINLGYTPKRAFLWIAAGVVLSLLLHALTMNFTLRTLGSARLRVLTVSLPLSLLWPTRASPLPAAPLAARLNTRLPAGTVHANSALIALKRRSDGSYVCTFESQMQSFDVKADHVVLALPFRTLRRVDLKKAGFDARKTRAINELQLGTNTKI